MYRNVFSVAYVLDRGGLWLGLKKERQLQREREQLGVGLYNGFGGLQKPGELIEVTAKRETLAESGLEVLEQRRCGLVLIQHSYKDVEVELHFFLVTEFQGTARETDEMIPKWFPWGEFPYDQMWPNDRYTLLLFLFGLRCVALFTINQERQLTAPPKVKVVETLPATVAWESYEF